MKLDTKSIVLDADTHKLIIIRNQIYKVKVKNRDCSQNIDILTGRIVELNGDEYLTIDISQQFQSDVLNIRIKDIIEIKEVFIK